MFTPKAATGATKFGVHYLGLFETCPTKWYNQYLRPHPDGGEGLRSAFTPGPLLVGRFVHEALAQWYISGVRDGEDTGQRDLDSAIAVVESGFTTYKDEFPDQDQYDTDLALVLKLVRTYDDWHGPDGVDPDWPKHQVVIDDQGLPIVEREYQIDIGQGYVYTCRIDLLTDEEGYYYIWEHKTSVASWVRRQMEQMGLSAQATGEMLVLQTQYPEARLGGVRANILVKNRGARSNLAPIEREVITRSQTELDKFLTDARMTLKSIDDHVARYHNLIDKHGHNPHAAAIEVFPMRGRYNGACISFNRRCQFDAICSTLAINNGESALGIYKPQAQVELTDTTDED